MVAASYGGHRGGRPRKTELVARVERALKPLEGILKLRDTKEIHTAQQVMQVLLRFCSNTTLTFFLRAMPPSVTLPAARGADAWWHACGRQTTAGAPAPTRKKKEQDKRKNPPTQATQEKSGDKFLFFMRTVTPYSTRSRCSTRRDALLTYRVAQHAALLLFRRLPR